MSEMNDKRWELHAEFLGELAGRVTWLAIAQGEDKIVAVNAYTRWLSEKCFRHAEGHCREDFENRVLESGKVVDEPLVDDSIVEVFGKVVGVTQKADVSENQMSGEISVSGDRVKRKTKKTRRVKREGPSWDKDKKGWDEAKRGPHVYENTESVGDEGVGDDSVIETQEECAKRFAEGEAVRRNYAGIND